MGTPAVVLGDPITGTCPNHLVPGPLGNPIPAPPMPFSSPLTMGLSTTVLIAGRPAAVAGSQGVNSPPHVGLHPADPLLAPPLQLGTVVVGSPTVLFDGRPAARTGSACTCCVVPGSLTGSAATVLIA